MALHSLYKKYSACVKNSDTSGFYMLYRTPKSSNSADKRWQSITVVTAFAENAHCLNLRQTQLHTNIILIDHDW